ncbi:helix-turn-helix domain-containing protein [Mariniflexile sp.]|uniref:helix-turn-helix domain-containing protein n=1 Tax=Mariniflexile sp. TaxID=1979402 RepID=UPI00356556D6
MQSNGIHISQILKGTISKPNNTNSFAVCWIKNGIDSLKIDGISYKNVANSIIFIDARSQWKLVKTNSVLASGYILFITPEILNNPMLSNLHINKVRLFNSEDIPLIQLSPGIEKRIQAILEMMDELLGSQLNHKDEAIMSLLNTFFIYCDGQCNIKSVASKYNSKAQLVYSFKQLVNTHVFKHHEVVYYADKLHISPKYLNECVKEVLKVGAKSIIMEQLLMRSRHALKFSNKTIKEISFSLGFSSPDYFCYFFKLHTGNTPSALRKKQ